MTQPASSFDERDKPSYRGLEDDRQTRSTRDTGVDDLHWGNLWDEDEDKAGQRTDEATGRRIDNSTYTDESMTMRAGASLIEIGEHGEEAVLEDWERPLDEGTLITDAFVDKWMEAAARGNAFDVDTLPEEVPHDDVA